MPSSGITTKDKWLLTLIGSNPHIRDRAELQEIIILTQKGILKNCEFFDDWELDKYGMHSSQLANSLEKLENDKYVIALDTFGSDKNSIRNYKLTDKGTTLKNKWIEDKKDQFAEIEHVGSLYFPRSGTGSISGTHLKIIDGMIGANIDAMIERYAINDMPFRNSENNPNEKESNSTKPSNSTKEHVFGDEEFRLKLAKSIGYDKIPALDPTAFDRLKGLFADEIESEYFDAVELVKESRGC